MKLACGSASFESTMAAGALTQLEWLDLCARELAVDGVVFDAPQFPRTDADYVAQLKKMSVDLGLTVAGLSCDAVLEPHTASQTIGEWMDVAWALAAPLLVARCPAAGGSAWNDLVATCKSAAAEAKRRNVTLALRNAAETPCASVADLSQLAKEVDSAWLRFACDPLRLDPPEPLDPVQAKTVIGYCAVPDDDGLADAMAAWSWPFRGFVVVELGANAEPSTYARTIALLRAAAATAIPSGVP